MIKLIHSNPEDIFIFALKMIETGEQLNIEAKHGINEREKIGQ